MSATRKPITQRSHEMSSLKGKIQQSGLKFLPKNLMSRIFGKVAATRFPKALTKAQIRWFAKRYGINMAEVKKQLDEFRSLQEFFVRELKSDARVIDFSLNSVISPCDGAWGLSGQVKNAELMQIKGRPYSMGRLLGDTKEAGKFEGGEFATFYLSPKDYHRFHMPLSGEIIEASHIPGFLWPVNPMAVKNIANLFCVNERIVIMVEPEGYAKHRLAIVAVGATMVGKVRVNFDATLATNRPKATYERRIYDGDGFSFAGGDELGRFEFGSTIILIATPGLLELGKQKMGTPVLMGNKIGKLRHAR